MLPVWIFLADFFLNSHCRSLFWQMVLSGRPSLYLHLVRPLHSDVSLCTLHCNQLNICDLQNVHHICTMFTKYAKWSQCHKFAQFEMCKWSQCSQYVKYEPAVWIDFMTSLCGHSLIFSVPHKTQYQVTQMLNKNWPVFSFCTSEQL